jgi:hypothetical protein
MMQKDRGGGQFQEQSHCKRGHPLSGENLRVRPGGVRSCRECSRNGQRARRVAEFSRRTS